MKYLFVMLCFITASQSYAQNKIIKLYQGDYLESHHNLFLDNGEIVHIADSNKEGVLLATKAYHQGLSVYLPDEQSSGNQARIIKSLSLNSDELSKSLLIGQSKTSLVPKEMYSWNRFRDIKWSSNDPLEKSNITSLATYDSAQKIMDKLNGDTDIDSQCYNRGHMWSYETLIDSGVTLGKIWIFFTKKYIKEYNYKWWFHIAPYTEVGSERFKYVLDRGFTMIPYTVKNWKDLYMKNKAECPVVSKYTDYEYHQDKSYCYLIYSSQYYWQPWQLESLDKRGIHRFGYKNKELKITYRDAITDWNGKIPKFKTTNYVEVEEEVVVENNVSDVIPSEPEQEEEVNEADLSGNTLSSSDDPVHENLISRDYIIRSGEIAYNISRDYAKVKVLEKNGRGYKIKFLSGSLAGEVGSGWRRSDLAVSHGCYEKFCVNDSFYISGRNSEKVKIVGLQPDGRFVLKFLDGPNSGELGGKWERKDLAVLEGCYQGVCVGDYVYNTKRDGAKVKILGKTLDNSFVIKFVSGELSGQRGSRWNAKYFALTEGCYKDLCVGDIVYKLDDASPKVKILGKTQNHKFVIKFLSGRNSGKHGTNWDREDFALTNGCHGKLCVGDIAYNTSRDNTKVKLVAKAMNNTFVIKFLQSNLSGKFGHNWSEDDLARTSGCYKSFCVGDIAYNTQRDNIKVKILAIEKKNTFVLKFLNGSLSGKKGNNWSYSDLKK